jgi:hypothetical protein
MHNVDRVISYLQHGDGIGLGWEIHGMKCGHNEWVKCFQNRSSLLPYTRIGTIHSNTRKELSFPRFMCNYFFFLMFLQEHEFCHCITGDGIQYRKGSMQLTICLNQVNNLLMYRRVRFAHVDKLE